MASAWFAFTAASISSLVGNMTRDEAWLFYKAQRDIIDVAKKDIGPIFSRSKRLPNILSPRDTYTY